MDYVKSKEYLDLRAVVTILGLTLLWGFNYTTIKYSNEGISPVFASSLRSIIASLCGVIYCLRKGERLFHKDIMLFHGFIVGLLFGLEFACLYLGMLYTDAARSVIFVYLSPFVVALGAHFSLKDDKLSFLKATGLILAFAGVLLVFEGKPKSAKPAMILGDILEIVAGFFWGATTLYIKRFMAEKIHPINTFLYQLVFSIPILLALSFILEPRWIYKTDASIIASIIYQSVIVAFISYFIWFKLIHKYAVSRLSAFTFFTPIFGVLFGTILLGEEVTPFLMVGLLMVSLGIFMVNWRRRPAL
ncbi:MAG: DMT family transporter [Deltaproteobacteria bacterium]|nr:DMT family transporter [Deltaproteobacteria bacterium]MBW2306331.1 DMT family transporter [Deltaproteobacteria bacterium]